MGKYIYLDDDPKNPRELKTCDGCLKESLISKYSRFCKPECWYSYKKETHVPAGEMAKHESTWDYIKADPKRLEKHRGQSSRSKKAVRQWLAEYKSGIGCIDCGFNTHFAALQLDHTGEKTAEISKIRSSVKRLQEEIEKGKCVVRCANCHSIKTWCEKNGVEYVPEDYQ